MEKLHRQKITLTAPEINIIAVAMVPVIWGSEADHLRELLFRAAEGKITLHTDVEPTTN